MPDVSGPVPGAGLERASAPHGGSGGVPRALLVTLALKVNSLVGIDQAPSSLAVVTGICPSRRVSGTFLVQLLTGNRLAMFLAPCAIGGFFILLFAVRLSNRRLAEADKPIHVRARTVRGSRRLVAQDHHAAHRMW